jgi:hypothetical protein
VAQAVGPAPPAVQEGRVTDTRPAVSRVLHVAEGSVESETIGPEGRIAAGYSANKKRRRGSDPPVVGGVVAFDALGARVRPAPLAVKEGQVTGVAFGPEGRIAAGYSSVFGGGVVVFNAP